VLGFAERLAALATDDERTAYMNEVNDSVRSKARLVKLAPVFYYDHVGRIGDAAFISAIRNYKAQTDDLFREVEVIRMPLAKHEVAGKEKLFAEAPGYGGVNNLTGSMYWQIVVGDDTVTIIERRALANKFLGIMSIYEEGEVKTNEPTKSEVLAFQNIERQVHVLRAPAPGGVVKGPPVEPDLGEDDFEGVE
jgi:hypothetical protein